MSYELAATLLACFLAVLLMLAAESRPRRSLIPSIGPTPGLMGWNRLASMTFFLKNTRRMLTSGYESYSRLQKPFLLASAMPPRIVIPSNYLTYIRNLPEEDVSHRHTISERFMGYWTGLQTVEDSRLHNEIIQTTLVQRLPELLPSLVAEAVRAMDDVLGEGSANGEWKTLNASESIYAIVARINSRVLVGPDFSHDQEWFSICAQYPQDVLALAGLLRMTPALLRPLVFYWSAAGKRLRSQTKLCRDKLVPVIQERRRQLMNGELATIQQHEDVLQWLIEQSSPTELRPRTICTKVLFLTMAGFHATTMHGVNTLFQVADDIRLQIELQAELETVVGSASDSNQQAETLTGWTLKAMSQLRKLDSVLKETQRFHPPAFLGVDRRVRRDLTMPDGVLIPKNSIISTPIYHMAHDQALWSDEGTFEPMRFYDQGHESRFATPQMGVLGFGYGRFACPGRVFAAAQLKLIIGLLLLRYELGPVTGDTERRLEIGESLAPNPAALFKYRRRGN